MLLFSQEKITHHLYFTLVLALFLSSITVGGYSNGNELSRQKRKTFFIEQIATKVGCFVTRLHEVKGTVWLIHNSTQLYVDDFRFDGEGPGVNFNIGMFNALYVKHK